MMKKSDLRYYEPIKPCPYEYNMSSCTAAYFLYIYIYVRRHSGSKLSRQNEKPRKEKKTAPSSNPAMTSHQFFTLNIYILHDCSVFETGESAEMSAIIWNARKRTRRRSTVKRDLFLNITGWS